MYIYAPASAAGFENRREKAMKLPRNCLRERLVVCTRLHYCLQFTQLKNNIYPGLYTSQLPIIDISTEIFIGKYKNFIKSTKNSQANG